MSNTPEPLWNVKDVMRVFGVSKSWVYQRVAAGTLPFLRLGGLIRFEPEAMRAWARGEPPPVATILPLSRKPTR
jgi:excisionase family DNA binding protein